MSEKSSETAAPAAQRVDAELTSTAAIREGEGEGGVEGGEKKPGRLQELLLEYGAIGIIVLLSISALTYLGFLVAILVGFEVEGADEMAGAFAAAAVGWAATKVIRIPLAIVLTPVVAQLWHRLRGRPPKKT